MQKFVEKFVERIAMRLYEARQNLTNPYEKGGTIGFQIVSHSTFSDG